MVTHKKSTKKHAPVKHETQAHHPAHKEHHAPAHHASHKKQTSSNDSIKNAAIVVLVIALVGVLIWAFTGTHEGAGEQMESTTASGSSQVQAAGNVQVDPSVAATMKTLADDDPYLGAADAPIVMVEFSDFQCPFCGKFESETFGQIKKNFIDTGLVKFVYRDFPLSFHQYAQKAAEAAGCAQEQGKYWEYHDTLFAHQDALDVDSLKKYAADLGLDVAQFNDCLDTDKYASEIAADEAAGTANGISGTPGFIINGKTISGAQPYDQFEQAICGLAPNSAPCQNIEPPTPVNVIVLNDAKCTTCDTSSIKATTSSYFPGAIYRNVDVSSDEGKQLVKDYGLTYAPAYIFDASVTETSAWTSQTQLAGFFDKLSDGKYRLKDSAVGASWFIDPAAQQAYLDQLHQQLGMVEGDNKPQVDFFVMSFCPYGNQAEELLKPVYDKLKGEADFNPRYVIYTQGTDCYTDTDGTQYCSLHGGQELNQDVREMCVFNNDGEQAWFDFALAMNAQCTAQNADSCWQDVAKSVGLDTDAIQSCFDANKLTYARQEYELNQKLGVTGSPTLFFEGQQYSGSRTSNGYLAALCNGFDNKPAACNDVIAENTTAAAAASTANCG